ncbi:MAG: hypothetical protein K8I01_08060 [Candidatus Methylomirabilis sp.]|nr:hypothetical protein [Deltaproteobacteria bacterium]
MGIECKTPEVDIEDKMLEDVLNTLQPKDVVIIDTDHCKTIEENEFEIFASLVARGRSKEDAARIAKAMAWDDE